MLFKCFSITKKFQTKLLLFPAQHKFLCSGPFPGAGVSSCSKLSIAYAPGCNKKHHIRPHGCTLGRQCMTLPVMASERAGGAARTRLPVLIIAAMQLVALHGATASSLLPRYACKHSHVAAAPPCAARAAGEKHGPVVFTHTHPQPAGAA